MTIRSTRLSDDAIDKIKSLAKAHHADSGRVHRYDDATWPLDYITREEIIEQLVDAGVIEKGDVAGWTDDGWLIGAYLAFAAAFATIRAAKKTAGKDDMTTQRKDSTDLSADEREGLIQRAVAAMQQAGVRVDEVRELEQKLRNGSDVYCRVRAEGVIASYSTMAREDDAARTRRMVREIEQVTAADREQAVADLELLYQRSQFASPHAVRRDEAEYTLAIDMRAREIARQRVARVDGLTRGRPADAPSDAFDPVTNGVGPWAVKR